MGEFFNMQKNLSERTYNCKSCGITIDRDLNASFNIRDEVIRNTVSSTEIEVCGEDINLYKFICKVTSEKQKKDRKISVTNFS